MQSITILRRHIQQMQCTTDQRMHRVTLDLKITPPAKKLAPLTTLSSSLINVCIAEF